MRTCGAFRPPWKPTERRRCKVKKQSKITVLLRMVKLVKPLTGFMLLAILMGTLGFLCAQFIPILGGYAVLHGLKINIPLSINFLWIALIGIALLRAVLKYAEQRTNHYIAFTLLAIIRDRVFQALRRLCPAKLEGRNKGDLISLITSDVELLLFSDISFGLGPDLCFSGLTASSGIAQDLPSRSAPGILPSKAY